MTSPTDLRKAIEAELYGNLLPFWRSRSLDTDHGGFIGEMSNAGQVRAGADKGLILNSRVLWTFSAVYRELGDDGDLALAQRAYRYLLDRFADRDHGGFLWLLDSEGRPLEDTKKIYGQAFCIYALSELYLATGKAGPLEEAQAVFDLIELYARDDEYGGYIESLSRDWSPAGDLRLSDKDMDTPKSMNNHLHVLEAYANLYRAWPDRKVAERLGELIDLFDRHIVGEDDGRCHLHHFFDKQWSVCSETYSYGHDIEAAWLLAEAAEVLGDESRQAVVHRRAEQLARSVLAEAVDADGGLAYEGRDGRVIDPSREWWCQAEAIVGFWQVYASTGREVFADAARTIWDFIDKRVIDRENGEWFWRVLGDGSIDESEPKVSEWKGPYHNTRMCLEMLRRLKA